MNRAIPLIFLLSAGGCAAVDQLAATAGVSQVAIADLNALGQLSCQAADGGWFQVQGANVVGATAQAVSAVCAAAQPGAVPGAAPDGTTARIVSAGETALSLLTLSKLK